MGVAVCYSVCWSVLQCVLQGVAVCYSVCCSVLQCVLQCHPPCRSYPSNRKHQRKCKCHRAFHEDSQPTHSRRVISVDESYKCKRHMSASAFRASVILGMPSILSASVVGDSQ